MIIIYAESDPHRSESLTHLLRNSDPHRSELVIHLRRNMHFDQTKVSRAEFEANLSGKLNDEAFVNDIFPLLPPEFNIADYHPITDAIHLQERIISQLPGDSWKGKPT